MRILIRIMAVTLVVALIGTIMPGPADAQNLASARKFGRSESWDFYLSPTYSNSKTINGQGGASVDLNDNLGLGLGFGYNFNDNFQLNSFLNWSSRKYDATVVDTNGQTRRYSNYLDAFSLTLNGVYYVLKGDISPFVSGGIGFTYVDTNIQSGPPSGTCWYDPWYGQVCNTYVPTATENAVNYNAGLGVRFDMNRQFGMQAGYYKTWVDIGKASGTPDFDIWRLDFIFRFGM